MLVHVKGRHVPGMSANGRRNRSKGESPPPSDDKPLCQLTMFRGPILPACLASCQLVTWNGPAQHSCDALRRRCKGKGRHQLDDLQLLSNDSFAPKVWKTPSDLTPVKKIDPVLLTISANSTRVREGEGMHSWNQFLLSGGPRQEIFCATSPETDWMFFRLSFCSSISNQSIKYQQKISSYSLWPV